MIREGDTAVRTSRSGIDGRGRPDAAQCRTTHHAIGAGSGWSSGMFLVLNRRRNTQ